jgi:endonuclease/exonuclease/phosphatase family metal-dependent hydrolase
MRWMWTACALGLLYLAACESDETSVPPTQTEAPLCARVDSLDVLAAPASYQYDYNCSGEVASDNEPLPSTGPADDCTTRIWPDLDDAVDVCPTVTDARRTDPVSGRDLPSADSRALPLELPVHEAGSFLPTGVPSQWPTSLRVVAWNMEYTASLDEQLTALTTHPELSTADVYLLSEVDRCSERNGVRRAARMLAEALEGDYVYGVEFVELSIGRTMGGDTGQAIVSRRPLSSVGLTCHSSHVDWFASEDEPRLGQRVVVHGDVPVGNQSVRLYALHFESNDLFGDKRSVQAKELLDVAQARACQRPQIVAGDFNAPYCGAPELDVFRNAGFIDAVGTAGDTEPTHSNGLRLDYVFTRGFRVIDGGVIRGLAASDHDPIWVDIELE